MQAGRLESHVRTALQLRDVFVDADVGQHGSADETIRRQPAKLFDKVIVERPHDGQERVPVPDGGVARFGGVEHLGVDAVGVLLLQPLFRRSRAAGVVEIEADGAELLGRLARELVRAADLERPAFLDDGVHAVGQLDAPGRPVAILRRHPMRPHVRGRLEVAVR